MSDEKKDNIFQAQDTLIEEVNVFSARLLDLVQQALVEFGYDKTEMKREVAPRVVHGLGMTAATYAHLCGVSEEQFAEAVIVYYRQVGQALAKLKTPEDVRALQERAKKPLIFLAGDIDDVTKKRD